MRRCFRRAMATATTSALWMAVALAAPCACQRPRVSGPHHRDPAIGPGVPKPVFGKARYWDGSLALIHPDGSRTLAVWPLQIQASDGDPEPVSRRCELVSQGAPYISRAAGKRAVPPKLQATATTTPRTVDPRAIAVEDPCAAEFGPTWRLPTLEEFNSYAPHLAKAGAWIVRTRSGEVKAVDYAPPVKLRLAQTVEISARTRAALTDTARIVCLSEASAALPPSEPSREEVEHCVRRFFSSAGDLAALLRVRLACREVASPSDWHPIVDGLKARVQALVDEMLEPSQLQKDTDAAAEDFVVGLLQTARTCLEGPRHSLGRANEAAIARVDELEATLDAAHEQRIERRRSQRFTEDWRTAPTIDPEPVRPVGPPQITPKPSRCGCAQGDLACTMRCAAKGN